MHINLVRVGAAWLFGISVLCLFTPVPVRIDQGSTSLDIPRPTSVNTSQISAMTNSTTPPAPPAPLLDFRTFQIIVSVVFSLIITAGLVGNALVIFTVLRWKDMQTSCNYLVMNIAIADFAVALVAAPLRIVEVHVGWPFGAFLCHFVVPLQDLFVCVSVLSHTAIALERYRAIQMPTKPRMSVRTTRMAIVSFWVLCYVTSSLPVALLVGLVEHMGWTYCEISWPSISGRRVYEIFLVVFYILVPLSIQSWAYISMRRTLKMKFFHTYLNSCRHVSESVPKERRQRRSANVKRRIRLIRVLCLMVVVFQICYIPRGVIMLVEEFGYLPATPAALYFNIGALILYYVKHVFNPIVLFLTSSEFRSHWKCTGKFFACLKANRGEENATPGRKTPKNIFIGVSDRNIEGDITVESKNQSLQALPSKEAESAV